ncbi:MAG TPA: serine/threonine-protein kinase [Polyangiaceae bacterium]|nr:serine/threonine-protein kinase [Polyangiaceae bacterium]
MAPPATAVSDGYQEGDVLLGRYTLLRPLARGGMGAVWRGRNDLLATDVAVKVVFAPQDVAEETEAGALAIRRAHSEAQLAAQLRHPAICQTFDFGVTEEGHPVVISELLRGEGLDKLLLREGKLEVARAIELLLPIVDALKVAHARGIVHRDVKPSNIFLARGDDGREMPKLLDFGIARATDQPTRITVAGTVCGTPDYMSPEQARGSGDVDARSDLWSICVTLYELVTGQVPFADANYNAVMFAVIHRPPAGLDELAAHDADLVRVIQKGLRKRREDRFQTAEELAQALHEVLLARRIGSQPVSERTASGDTLPSARFVSVPITRALVPGRRRRSPKQLAALLGVALMALSGWALGTWYRGSTPSQESEETSAAATPATTPREPAAAPVAVTPPRRVEVATAISAKMPTASTLPEPKLRKPEAQPEAAAGPVGSVAAAKAATTPAPAPRRPNALNYDFGL